MRCLSRLTGHDAVLSCLGFQPEKPKVTGYLEATKASLAIRVVWYRYRIVQKRRENDERITFREDDPSVSLYQKIYVFPLIMLIAIFIFVVVLKSL